MNASLIHCKNVSCNVADDQETCLVKDSTCATMPCPDGYEHRYDADDILCDDSTCADTSYHKCCALEGHCDTFSCPDGFVPKHGEGTIECHGFRCDDRDRDTC